MHRVTVAALGSSVVWFVLVMFKVMAVAHSTDAQNVPTVVCSDARNWNKRLEGTLVPSTAPSAACPLLLACVTLCIPIAPYSQRVWHHAFLLLFPSSLPTWGLTTAVSYNSVSISHRAHLNLLNWMPCSMSDHSGFSSKQGISCLEAHCAYWLQHSLGHVSLLGSASPAEWREKTCCPEDNWHGLRRYCVYLGWGWPSDRWSWTSRKPKCALSVTAHDWWA